MQQTISILPPPSRLVAPSILFVFRGGPSDGFGGTSQSVWTFNACRQASKQTNKEGPRKTTNPSKTVTSTTTQTEPNPVCIHSPSPPQTTNRTNRVHRLNTTNNPYQERYAKQTQYNNTNPTPDRQTGGSSTYLRISPLERRISMTLRLLDAILMRLARLVVILPLARHRVWGGYGMVLGFGHFVEVEGLLIW